MNRRHDDDRLLDRAGFPGTEGDDGRMAPGKRSLTMSLPGTVRRKVQLDRHDPGGDVIERAAGEGLATPVTDLPYHNEIQASFGSLDISHVKAHTGDAASASAA